MPDVKRVPDPEAAEVQDSDMSLQDQYITSDPIQTISNTLKKDLLTMVSAVSTLEWRIESLKGYLRTLRRCHIETINIDIVEKMLKGESFYDIERVDWAVSDAR